MPVCICKNCGEPNFFMGGAIPPRVKCSSCGNTFRTEGTVNAEASHLVDEVSKRVVVKREEDQTREDLLPGCGCITTLALAGLGTQAIMMTLQLEYHGGVVVACVIGIALSMLALVSILLTKRVNVGIGLSIYVALIITTCCWYNLATHQQAVRKIESTGGRVEWRFVDLSQSNNLKEVFAPLGKLFGLRHVSFSGTEVQDSDLYDILEVESIRELDLSNTAITDQALETISFDEDLIKLNVSGTQVTAEGAQKLKEARPELEVVQTVR